MLASVFGFDKYSEITSEQASRGTYCDLAVKLGGSIQYLIEVKAIGLKLKEIHMRQALNYGANQGITWVVLTNGINWQVYKIRFEKPVDHELVFHFDFLKLSPRKRDDHDLLYLLCRGGITKDFIKQYHEKAQTVNRFVVAALIQTDLDNISVIRKILPMATSSSYRSSSEINAGSARESKEIGPPANTYQ